MTRSAETTTSTSLAEATAHPPEVVGRVGSHHERVLVTVHGTPSAVLIAPADLEALERKRHVVVPSDDRAPVSVSLTTDHRPLRCTSRRSALEGRPS